MSDDPVIVEPVAVAFLEAVLLIVCGVEGFHQHHETVANEQYVMTTFLFSTQEIA